MKNTHLPTGWQEFKLKDICNIQDGIHTTPNYVDKGIKFISVENISNIYASNKFISVEDYNNLYKVKAKKNDIFMTRIGDIGTPAVVTEDEELAYYVTISLLSNINKKIYYKYLYYAIQSHNFQRELYARTLQVAFPKKINLGEIGECKFISPPLEEQKRIAEVLSLCDDIIENLTELIDKKEQYKKGVIQRLLSGEVRFKGFTDEWQTVRLGDILSYEQPNNYIVKNDEYNNKYECPVLTAGKTFVLGYTNEKFGIYNEIPVIIFDDFTTETKYVNFPFKVKSSAIKILSSNKCNLKLIYELIKMIKFNAESHKRYWISEYQYLEIKIPKSIEEQKKIAGLLSLIDEDIENLKKQLELRKQQKKGLMQRLLTGEVRI